MKQEFYDRLAQDALEGKLISKEDALTVLTDFNVEILPLMQAAYKVRKEYCGHDVLLHILNNAQNGYCPEDCSYCAQAKTSEADIEKYSKKEEAEILAEAKNAYESGAFRYCMVYSGRGPSKKRVETLSNIIKKIKSTYPIQVCLSAGLMGDEATQQLKEAGLDRMNHNLNTTKERYEKICTTHTYQDRLDTLNSAKKANLDICSGLIVGMGESPEEVYELACKLREVESHSIPVNFYMPIEGTNLDKPSLSPAQCLRILALFRFINPKAEIRAAAGREIHLRSQQVLAFYAANSIFVDGYLNTTGTDIKTTMKMIEDAGFKVKSHLPLEPLIEAQEEQAKSDDLKLKSLKDLRPQLN